MRYGAPPTELSVSGAFAPAEDVPSSPPPRRRMRWGRWGWITLAAVVAIGVGALVRVTLDNSSKPSVSKADVGKIVDNKVGSAMNDLKNLPPPGVGVFNAVRPGIVVIEQGSGKDESLGSGVIINTQGQILTAAHVVQNPGTITLTYADGTQSGATVQSTDPDHDIAVLNADKPPGVIVPVTLGGGVRVGDETFALGHPLGLVDSLTAGVISGLDRAFPLPNGKTINGLIQFDAPVSPGNSGGPLLNTKGQVVGIVTGLANPSGNEDNVGIGFAVPIGAAGRAAGAPAQ